MRFGAGLCSYTSLAPPAGPEMPGVGEPSCSAPLAGPPTGRWLEPGRAIRRWGPAFRGAGAPHPVSGTGAEHAPGRLGHQVANWATVDTGAGARRNQRDTDPAALAGGAPSCRLPARARHGSGPANRADGVRPPTGEPLSPPEFSRPTAAHAHWADAPPWTGHGASEYRSADLRPSSPCVEPCTPIAVHDNVHRHGTMRDRHRSTVVPLGKPRRRGHARGRDRCVDALATIPRRERPVSGLRAPTGARRDALATIPLPERAHTIRAYPRARPRRGIVAAMSTRRLRPTSSSATAGKAPTRQRTSSAGGVTACGAVEPDTESILKASDGAASVPRRRR